jgi:SH3-like domain-containing protein
MTNARRRVRVRIDYVAQYPNPIRGRTGQSVTVVRRDSEYPEWVWCIGPDGREGWVPLIVLQINEEDAVLVRDYDARELSVNAGDDVEVHEEIGGWMRVSSADGHTGWIPAHCLTSA